MQIKEVMVGATEKIGESYIKAEVRADVFPGEDMNAVRAELVEEVNKTIEAQSGHKPATVKKVAKKTAPKKEAPKEEPKAEEPKEEAPKKEPAKKKVTKKKASTRKPKILSYDRTLNDHKERIADILDDALPGWRVEGSEEKGIAGKVSQAVVGVDFLDGDKVLPAFIEKVVATVDENRGV